MREPQKHLPLFKVYNNKVLSKSIDCATIAICDVIMWGRIVKKVATCLCTHSFGLGAAQEGRATNTKKKLINYDIYALN